MPKAAIDLGSNSVLLTVLDDLGHVLHDEARVVGLGKVSVTMGSSHLTAWPLRKKR